MCSAPEQQELQADRSHSTGERDRDRDGDSSACPARAAHGRAKRFTPHSSRALSHLTSSAADAARIPSAALVREDERTQAALFRRCLWAFASTALVSRDPLD